MLEQLQFLKALLDELARDSSLGINFDTLTVGELRAILAAMDAPERTASLNVQSAGCPILKSGSR